MPEMLLKPFVQHRSRISARLPEPTVKAMNHVLGVKTTQVDTNSERKPKKCSQCLDKIKGTKGYKQAKDKLSKHRDICQKCKSVVFPQTFYKLL